MSMHKIPMTGLERTGLIKHGLPIGAPSQLSDAFRNGVIHASKEIAELQAALAERDAKLAALEKQEPVAWLVYANGSHRYSTLTFDVSKVPDIYVGGDVVALYAAAGAAPAPEDWRSAVAMAYGHLWHVNNEPMAPIPLRSEESASYAARKLLRDLLTTEERGEAINSVRAMLTASPKEPT